MWMENTALGGMSQDKYNTSLSLVLYFCHTYGGTLNNDTMFFLCLLNAPLNYLALCMKLHLFMAVKRKCYN